MDKSTSTPSYNNELIVRLRIISSSDDSIIPLIPQFTIPPTQYWRRGEILPPLRNPVPRAGLVYEWGGEIDDMDAFEDAMFKLIIENKALIFSMRNDCDIIVEYYCYMTDSRCLVQLSRERVDVLTSIGACLAVEVYPTSK